MTIYEYPFCTYLTVYSGNKLPPFYIGYTKTENIHKGYRGSVCSKSFKKIWYDEIRDNPHLFKTHIISLHKTRKEANDREMQFQNHLSILKKPSMYINRSIGKHKTNHGSYNPMFGRKHSTESLNKQRETIKKRYEAGYINPRKNKKDAQTSKRMKLHNPNADGHVRKGAIISPETRRKISEANKGKTAHNKIVSTFIWKCLNCKKEKVLTAKKNNKNKKFCCQHCYREYKIYTNSQPPAEQANSFIPSV
jgi:hypothetical protein